METEKLTDAQLVYCKVILKSHPLFFNLSNETIHEIASLFVHQSFSPNDIITKEEDLVDSIFFIEKGIAEVRKVVHLAHGVEVTPVAMLRAQESIGLNETGFFSTTGKRSASVIALSVLSAFRLDIKKFNAYLSMRPSIKQNFQTNSGLFLKANFIKAVVPFDEVSTDTILKLANKVVEKKMTPGELIIQQGEEGKDCFLLNVGKVEVLLKNPQGENDHLAILEPPTLFGETALLMESKRNATVKAVTKCDLLVIDRDTLVENITNETQAKQTLMTIISMRSRPVRHDNIKSFFTKTAEGDEIIILKDAKKNEFFRLTKEGWYIWQNLDGRQSLRDITMNFFAQFQIFNPTFASKLVSDLEKIGFVTVHEPVKKTRVKKKVIKTVFASNQFKQTLLALIILLIMLCILIAIWFLI